MSAAQPSKVCTLCRQEKPCTEFVRDRRKPGGIGWPCKACKAKRNHAFNHSDRGRALWALRERDRTQDPAERAAQLQRRAKNRRTGPKYQHDPIKQIARATLSNAVRSGSVVRPDACQDCGVKCHPDGHHHDYSKPLDVEWLCATCHGARHRKDIAPEHVQHYESKWNTSRQSKDQPND